MKKKILVTGATGFIGKHVMPLLDYSEYEVHAIATKKVASTKEVNFHSMDLLDLAQIAPLMQKIKPTHLLHLAWYTTPGKYWSSPMNLDWVKASLELVQQFVQNGGQRAVFAGTCAEYDWSSGYCCETNTPLSPNTLYGTCKASLYKMIESYAKQVNLSYAWGRIFFLYGPHEHPSRLVPNIINNLLKKESAKCSHGNQIRDFLHIEDVADAFVKLIDSEINGPINIASGNALPLKNIIQIIGEKLQSSNLIQYGAVQTAASEPMKIEANNYRLSQELQWSPRYVLEEGLNETINWWKAKQ